MILLFTDFGTEGPYVGQMKAVLHGFAGTVPVVDLMHDAPAARRAAGSNSPLSGPTKVRPSSRTTSGARGPPTPGSTTARITASWGINGNRDANKKAAGLGRAAEAEWFEITWCPESLRASFHGRDLFAPVAARLASGAAIGGLAVETAAPRIGADWPDDLPEVIYLDRFGNAMTGLRTGTVQKGQDISWKNIDISYARTFTDTTPDSIFWYENSNGLIEIAVNGGSAAKTLGLSIGTPVSFDG